MGNQPLAVCCTSASHPTKLLPTAWRDEEEEDAGLVTQDMDWATGAHKVAQLHKEEACVIYDSKDLVIKVEPREPPPGAIDVRASFDLSGPSAQDGCSAVFDDSAFHSDGIGLSQLIDAESFQRTRQPRLTLPNLELVDARLTPRNEPLRRFVGSLDTPTGSVARQRSSQLRERRPSLTIDVASVNAPKQREQAKPADVISLRSIETATPHSRITNTSQVHGNHMLECMEIMPSSAMQVVIDNIGDLREFYDIDGLLGKGSFGLVKRATVKSTHAVRAVKTMSKGLLEGKIGLMKRELQITKSVDHPNLIRLFDVWESDDDISLVLELCTGGALSQRLKKQGRFTEAQTASVMCQVFRGLSYMHCNSICHRDMKPENCLCVSKDPVEKAGLANIKISDFGLSCICHPRSFMSARAGTTAYMAPEVFQKKYTQSCDVWSVGVMMYELLCGYMPYKGKDDKELAVNIQQGSCSFGTSEWSDASQSALSFVAACLKKNPLARQTPQQALHHEFMETKLPKLAPPTVDDHMFEKLRDFRKMSKLQRAFLCIVASIAPHSAVKHAQDTFCSFDTCYDGRIQMNEVIDRLRSCGVDVPSMPDGWRSERGGSMSSCGSPPSSPKATNRHQDRGQKKRKKGGFKARRRSREPVSGSPILCTAVGATGPEGDTAPLHDHDDDGGKDFTYTEFLAANIDRKFVLQKNVCQAVFRCFDRDRSGEISLEEIANGRLMGHMSLEDLGRIMAQIDVNGDGVLDFQEFMHLMAQMR